MMSLSKVSPAVRHLRVLPMTDARVPQSLPLAQGLRSDLTLDDWERFCTLMLTKDDDTRQDSFKGMDCVVDENDYLLGLAGYEVRPDLRHGRVLSVDPFIAIDLYGRDQAAQQLLIRMDRLAEEQDCTAVHIAFDGVDGRFPRQCGSTFSKFMERGYRADCLRLCKEVEAAV